MISSSDMMDLPDYWEKRRELYIKISDNSKFQENMKNNKEKWTQELLKRYPNLTSSKDSLEESIRSVTFIDYLVRNELHTADAPFLQPRDANSSDPMQKTGIEDLVEKFVNGDFAAASEQVQNGIELIDNSAFSVGHNIHMGLLALHILREEAVGLRGHLKALEKSK